jgi:hypothetical protein
MYQYRNYYVPSGQNLVFPAMFHNSCNLFQIAISVRPEDRFVFMSDVYPSYLNSTAQYTRSVLLVLALVAGVRHRPHISALTAIEIHVQLPGITFLKTQKIATLNKMLVVGGEVTTKFLTFTQQKNQSN